MDNKFAFLQERGDLTLWKSIWLGAVCLIFSLALCIIFSIVWRYKTLELCCYSRMKPSRKKMAKKQLKALPWRERIFLYGFISRQPERRGAVWLCWGGYMLYVLLICLLPFAWIAVIVTRGADWAGWCLVMFPYKFSIGVELLTLIPDIILFPDIREMHFPKRKRK